MDEPKFELGNELNAWIRENVDTVPLMIRWLRTKAQEAGDLLFETLNEWSPSQSPNDGIPESEAECLRWCRLGLIQARADLYGFVIVDYRSMHLSGGYMGLSARASARLDGILMLMWRCLDDPTRWRDRDAKRMIRTAFNRVARVQKIAQTLAELSEFHLDPDQVATYLRREPQPV